MSWTCLRDTQGFWHAAWVLYLLYVCKVASRPGIWTGALPDFSPAFLPITILSFSIHHKIFCPDDNFNITKKQFPLWHQVTQRFWSDLEKHQAGRVGVLKSLTCKIATQTAPRFRCTLEVLFTTASPP
jgi:hypothetical protein